MLGAAVLVASHAVAKRRFADALATAVAASVAVMCLVLLAGSLDGPIVEWFGDWPPRDDVVIGIGFVIDPLGAGMASLCAALVTAVFVYTWRYFDAIGVLFHALLLVFLAAICGFCLTGDLFNLFVYFELMSVAAYSLTGYKAEEPGPLQGALNFAITNTVGALMVLSGIALLYARTGALNLAAIGRALPEQGVDGLVVVAFVLVVFGFLVKGAVVPFHFWLADAHAVAPSPVCVLFSGIMVELGLYAAARTYWTVFSPVFSVHGDGLRALLVGIGITTALVGGVMALVQAHFKRMLAFSTVTYAGMFLIGFGLLDARALAGVALFVLAHGLLKGSMFMCAGVFLHRFGTVDIPALTGRGRVEALTGVLFVIAGAGLVGVPPLGTFVGKHLIEEAASDVGYGWIVIVIVVASALTVAAGLRAAARIFLGWDEGDPAVASEVHDHAETLEGRTRTPRVMFVPIAVLVAAGLAVGLVPGLEHGAERAAARFIDAPAYAAAVIDGGPESVAEHAAAEESGGFPTAAVVASAITLLLSVLLALALLERRRLPGALVRRVQAVGGAVLDPLRALHSGHIGDYVAWLTVGVATFGGILAAVVR